MTKIKTVETTKVETTTVKINNHQYLKPIPADVTADKSAKVYIKNHNDRGDGTKFVNILLAAVEIGRLYGGDWMFIPWCAASGKDIEFTASDATETTLEYTCFYE